MNTPSVAVIGAGAAGLSAAVRLASEGERVMVIERAPRLGGRASAFTDKASGERVDNGQHVLFGCYRETYAFLRMIGTAGDAPLDPALRLVMVSRDGRRSDLVCPRLPAPWHLLAGLARWTALPLGDRWRAMRVGRAIARARRIGASAAEAEVPPDLTVSDWLKHHRQSDLINAWLWHPLTLAALNELPEVAAARPFVRVAAELFGPRAEDAAVGLPRVPLDELYAEPARRFIEARGGAVVTGERAVVAIDGARVTGVHVGGRFAAVDRVVAAVPWFAFASLWADDVPPALGDVAATAAAMASAPIVTVNLWLDGPVIDEPFVGLVDGPVHWVFDKARIAGESLSHLALVTSGATQLAGLENDDITRIVVDHLRSALPRARDRAVRRSVVVRERRATFSLAPGAPPRPPQATAIGGLVLAGDWTDTGLPATIEGAVQSGHTAAALLRS